MASFYVKQHFSTATKWWSNRFAVVQTVVPTQQPAGEALAVAWVQHFIAAWRAIQSEDVLWQYTYVYQDELTFGEITGLIVDAEPGTVVSQPLPMIAPVILTLYSEFQIGKKRRYWISGVPETFQDAGQLTAAGHVLLSAYADLFTEEIEEPLGGAGRWQVWLGNQAPSLSHVTMARISTNLGRMKDRRAPIGFNG